MLGVSLYLRGSFTLGVSVCFKFKGSPTLGMSLYVNGSFTLGVSV